jgi:hypothetical protein
MDENVTIGMAPGASIAQTEAMMCAAMRTGASVVFRDVDI